MSTETEALPALTPDDMEFERYGVHLMPIGEDCDTLLALGHVEERRMVAAAWALKRNGDIDWMGYYTSADEALGAVEHVWAIRVAPPDEHEEESWWVSWGGVTADTPGAFPVTLLEV